MELDLQSLKVSQGIKYISVNVNNTLVPVAIAIYDRQLLCVWEEQEELLLPGVASGENLLDRPVPFCSLSPTQELNFDYVAIGDSKVKKLKLTNVNPVNITLESIAKQQLDDLNIYIEKVVDKNGNQVYPPTTDPKAAANDTVLSSILGPKRTKRLLNYPILPYQTVLIVFKITGKEPK